jgi:hypothetical protein
MSWVHTLMASSNRLARIQQGHGAVLPPRAMAEAAADLCLRYRELLTDSLFCRDMPEAAGLPPAQRHLVAGGADAPHVLRCNLDHALALLVEAGVEGEHALEAVRSVEAALRDPQWEPPDAEQLFVRLRDARDAACALRASLAQRAEAAEGVFRLRRMGLAGVGLVLAGVSAAALAPVAAAGAVAGAIGTTIFQHNTRGLKES